MPLALITIDEYKDLQGIGAKSQDTQDEIIQTYIDGVSQLVKTYCGYSFVDFYNNFKTETFTMDYDQYFVQLSELPLRQGTITVKERTSIKDAFSSVTALTNDDDYYIDYSSDTIYRVTGGNAYKAFPRGPGSVEVVYKAGYDIANKLLPDDLTLAIADMVTYYFKDQTKSRQTIAGASIQTSTSSSQKNSVDFPDHIKRVLDLYKNY